MSRKQPSDPPPPGTHRPSPPPPPPAAAIAGDWLRERERADRAEALLRRIREWDTLDTTADGPYWKREIDHALSKGPR